ncbi:MAG: hypothetical protein FJ125_16080, partial [Deltaproteobacteria bacterium]|nr:hypothetical protein [Deltaproteobacteria bacterium]
MPRTRSEITCTFGRRCIPACCVEGPPPPSPGFKPSCGRRAPPLLAGGAHRRPRCDKVISARVLGNGQSTFRSTLVAAGLLLLLLLASGCEGVAPPIAAAGPDQQGMVARLVQLDGSASRSPRERPLAYRWSFVAKPPGSASALALAGTAHPWFVPDALGRFELQLVVDDGELVSMPDRVAVEVTCSAELQVQAALDGGGPAEGPVGVPVALSATVQAVPVGDCPAQPVAARLRWAILEAPAGSQAGFADPTVARPLLLPDRPGRFVVAVTARGMSGQEAVAHVEYLATCGDAAPVVEAILRHPRGEPRPGERLVFSAEVRDPDEEPGCGMAQPLAHRWQLLALPPGSRAALSGPRLPMAQLIPDLPGDYRLQLEVRDPQGHAGRAELAFSVGTCGSRPPVIAELRTLTERVVVGSPVGLSATVSDPDDDPSCSRGPGQSGPIATSWTLRQQPAGSRSRIVPDGALQPFFTPDLPGDYLVELRASDATGLSTRSTLLVSASSCGGSPPSVALSLVTPEPLAAGVPVHLRAEVRDADAEPPCSL